MGHMGLWCANLSMFSGSGEGSGSRIPFTTRTTRSFAACSALTRLDISMNEGVTRDGLAGLCAASRSLKVVACYGCYRDVS